MSRQATATTSQQCVFEQAGRLPNSTRCLDFQLGSLACKGNSMRMILAVLVLCAYAPCALAKEPECRAIENTTVRLACYDAAYPLKLEKPAIVENDATRPPYKDPFVEEEARTAAKLKNICRGC
jgi:hypothetical protein